MTITADGASANNKFMKRLVAYFHEQTNFNNNEQDSRLYCFAHVMNLSVQTLLKEVR